jgi:hypothetical protein
MHMSPPNPHGLTASEDGSVHLTVAELKRIPLVHLISGLDETDATPTASPAITGYTEWVSEGSPAITLGWDWQLLPGTPGPSRVNDARSNLVLVDDSSGIDECQDKITMLLNTYVDQMNWQASVLGSLQIHGQERA